MEHSGCARIIPMRKPTEPERLYLDFDGFFASCEQFAHPHLRGKPVGIIPMRQGSSCVIAVSREAKTYGIKNVTPLREAQRLCPDLILWPQNPDLYRRAHNELISEISMVAPVDAVKSIDELTCRLDATQMKNPLAVGLAIKKRLKAVVGPWIACSIGYGANRLLAKMACKDSKPAGNLVWHPKDAETILATKKLDDVPGIGSRMLRKLWAAQVWDMETLLKKGPGEMRALWHSVTGERMYYALHGYDIQAEPTERGMYGHSRILPPSHRRLDLVKPISRMLMIKATRRMRRDSWRAGSAYLGLAAITGDGGRYWGDRHWMPSLSDYTGILQTLDNLWARAFAEVDPVYPILRVDVSLGELMPMAIRQLDLLADDEGQRLEQEAIASAIDRLNHRYGGTVITPGFWTPPPGEHTGAKISYTRIPRREDFN